MGKRKRPVQFDLRDSLEDEIERANKKEKKDKIILGCLIVALVIAIIFVSYLSCQYSAEALERCTNAGHSRNYCLEKI